MHAPSRSLLLLLLAGFITGVIGALVGLPALRLSGLYLALITLMAAGAITVILKSAQFPNGGGGFFGNTTAGGATVSLLPRPGIATGDTAYYRYCAIVAGPHVRVRALARQGQARTCLGGDPPESALGDRCRREHDALTSSGRSRWPRS